MYPISNTKFDILLRYLNSIKSMQSGRMRLVLFLGQLGDLDSFECAQLLKRNLQLIQTSTIQLKIIAIGDQKGLDRFVHFVGLPSKYFDIKIDGSLHNDLGLCPGLNLKIPALANLLLMCAGIGSPGTLKEVFRGYIGDRNSQQIFNSQDKVYTGIAPVFKGSLFHKGLGSGYLRPFEMATLRLGNMFEILSNWNTYIIDRGLLTQRGATFLIDKNDNLLYSFKSTSLLGYAEKMANPLYFLKPYFRNSEEN